jgi:hypothetical protein
MINDRPSEFIVGIVMTFFIWLLQKHPETIKRINRLINNNNIVWRELFTV